MREKYTATLEDGTNLVYEILDQVEYSVLVKIDEPNLAKLQINLPHSLPLPKGQVAKAALINSVLADHYKSCSIVYNSWFNDMEKEYHEQATMLIGLIKKFGNIIGQLEFEEMTRKVTNHTDKEVCLNMLEENEKKILDLFKSTIMKYCNDVQMLSTAKIIDECMREQLNQFIKEKPGFFGS